LKKPSELRNAFIEFAKRKETKEIIEDFIEFGERLMDKLKKLLKSCETPMLRAGTKKQTAQVTTVEHS
jgi:t-SNARE complex subunit (syntaxin)